MAEMSKEQLILECTKILTPLIHERLGKSYSPDTGIFIKMCVSAGKTMAEQIQDAANLLPDKK
jgi:hypothetical protein